jgi:hypothetical protein
MPGRARRPNRADDPLRWSSGWPQDPRQDCVQLGEQGWVALFRGRHESELKGARRWQFAAWRRSVTGPGAGPNSNREARE